MNIRNISISSLVVAVIFLAVYMWKQEVVAPEVATIDNFADCLAAGYPVAESYPRQCRTPEGIMFVEELATTTTELGGCQGNESCPIGQFCNQGICQVPSYDSSCKVDDDCLLVNNELAYSCCYAGACQAIDYSESKWVAVNVADYSTKRSTYCPADDKCGPAPGCPSQYTPSNFVARCQQNVCVKTEPAGSVPKVPGDQCLDACGDRRCQPFTDCYGPSCLCPETIETCPKDCDPVNWPD